MNLLKYVSIMLMLINSVPANSAEWINLANTDRQFDKSRIRIDGDGVVWVWLKFVKPEDSIKRLESKLSSIGNKVDFSDYSYSIEFGGINCKQKTDIIKSGLDYASNGRVINSWNDEDAKLEPMIPDSIGEIIDKEVCKFVSKKKKDKKR